MAAYASPTNWRSPTWRDYSNLQALLLCALLIGPAIFLYGVFGIYRDRPSLQWPTVIGTILESELHYSAGRQSHYHVTVSYVYHVDDQRYIGRQITLYNPDLRGDGNTAKGFIAAHPLQSAVDVYHDPLHPERAVLIPGADEIGDRRSMWSGTVIFGVLACIVLGTQKILGRAIAEKKAEETVGRHRGKIAELARGFISYEPANQRKLYCFSDRDSLFEVLGKNGGKIQDWKQEDRVIDTDGREFRLVKSPKTNSYGIEATGETWSAEKLLTIAEADALWLKVDAEPMRQRVKHAPMGHEIPVLMKCIDDFYTGPGWRVFGIAILLLLSFLAVVLIIGKLIARLHK